MTARYTSFATQFSFLNRKAKSKSWVSKTSEFHFLFFKFEKEHFRQKIIAIM